MPGAGAHSRLWDDAEDSADLQSAGPGQMSREPEHDPGGEDGHQVRDLTPGHQGLSLQNCMKCSFCCFFPFDSCLMNVLIHAVVVWLLWYHITGA